MVHDINDLIYQKIRTEEQIPMHWEKDQVWKSIKRGPKPHRKPIFYYAAASIVLATSLVVYFINKMEDQISYQRIKTLETAINDHLKSQLSKETISFPTLAECETASKGHLPSAQKVRAGRRSTSDEFTPTASNTFPAEEQAEVSSKTEVVDLEAPPQPEQVTDQPKIEAIIGFIPPQQEKITAVKVKKVKFRFFRENDLPQKESFAGETATVLTARIN